MTPTARTTADLLRSMAVALSSIGALMWFEWMGVEAHLVASVGTLSWFDAFLANVLSSVIEALWIVLITMVGVALLEFMEISRQTAVCRPPASRINVGLRFIFPARTYDRIFGQIITDMREEYLEALAAGDRWHARWIHGRVYIILGATILTWIPTALAKRIVAMWKAF